MKIYDVVNELEKLLKENNSDISLILHRNMQEHPVMKVMKRFNYTLYLKEGNAKKKIIEEQFVDKCPTGELLEVWEKHDILFVFHILKWMNTEEYKNIRNGVQ